MFIYTIDYIDYIEPSHREREKERKYEIGQKKNVQTHPIRTALTAGTVGPCPTIMPDPEREWSILKYTVEFQWRQGEFEQMSVNHNARSGGIIGCMLDFLKHECILCVLIRIASSRRFY